LGEFIASTNKKRLVFHRGSSFSFDPLSLQFPDGGTKKLSIELVFMDIVETPDVAVVQAVPAVRNSENPAPSNEATQKDTAPPPQQRSFKKVVEAQNPGPGQARQPADPTGEKILWICGMATPDTDERENFSGAWTSHCTVPSEAYFEEWTLTRVMVTNAIHWAGCC